jgi:hypothetical protein
MQTQAGKVEARVRWLRVEAFVSGFSEEIDSRLT